MATVYLADNYFDPMPQASNAGGIELTRPFIYTLTAAFIINDTIKLCPIPGSMGIILTEWMVLVPDLDSSTGVELQLGDTVSAAKFMAANTVGQAGGRVYSLLSGVAGVLPVAYRPDGTATRRGDVDLILKVSTAPSGTAATTGTIKGYMRYVQYGLGTGF
jgi:hypothetical protein